MTPWWVADCSAAHPTVLQFQAAGAVGVMRYIDPGRNDGTEISPQEIADYHANNFPYGLVCEYSADWLEGGYTVGHNTAVAVLAEEANLGIPKGVTYLAADFDIQPSQAVQALAAMQGFADAYGGRQYVRPYGSKFFCEFVQGQWGFQGCWSTDAWSGYQTANGSVLHQHAGWPAGVPMVPGCDYNDVLGDWAPRNTSEDDMTPAQDLLLKTVGGAVMQLAGKVDALAQTVIHGDATHYSLDHLAKDMGSLLAKAGVPDPAVLAAVAGVQAAVQAIPAGSGGSVDLQPVLNKIDALKLGVVQ